MAQRLTQCTGPPWAPGYRLVIREACRQGVIASRAPGHAGWSWGDMVEWHKHMHEAILAPPCIPLLAILSSEG